MGGRGGELAAAELSWRTLSPAWKAEVLRLRLVVAAPGEGQALGAGLPWVRLSTAQREILAPKPGAELQLTAAERSFLGFRSLRVVVEARAEIGEATPAMRRAVKAQRRQRDQEALDIILRNL